MDVPAIDADSKNMRVWSLPETRTPAACRRSFAALSGMADINVSFQGNEPDWSHSDIAHLPDACDPMRPASSDCRTEAGQGRKRHDKPVLTEREARQAEPASPPRDVGDANGRRALSICLK